MIQQQFQKVSNFIKTGKEAREFAQKVSLSCKIPALPIRVPGFKSRLCYTHPRGQRVISQIGAPARSSWFGPGQHWQLQALRGWTSRWEIFICISAFQETKKIYERSRHRGKNTLFENYRCRTWQLLLWNRKCTSTTCVLVMAFSTFKSNGPSS